MSSLCMHSELAHVLFDFDTDHLRNHRKHHPGNLFPPHPFHCRQLHVCIVPMVQRTMNVRAEAARTSGPCTDQELPRIRWTIMAASSTGAARQRLDVYQNMVLGSVSATPVAERLMPFRSLARV